MVYAVVSDIHAYNWSAFGGVDSDGVSTRLRVILSELERAASELIAAGGTDMIIAGDIFHTRGSIDPEVFNPTHETFRRIVGMGLQIYAIPGNHDLKGRETTTIGNAIQTLSELDGFNVISEPTFYTYPGIITDEPVAFLPWISRTDNLRSAIDEMVGKIDATPHHAAPVEKIDLFIHAGVDGVLPGMPDHGLTAAELADYGFKRVFAGHYHNHKVMEGGKVISIGALTHQTWGDIGTKAGFLLVYDDKVVYRASHAPSFVEVTGDTDPDEVPLLVDGNYVRIRGMKLTDAEIATYRGELKEMGALGVTFQVARETVAARGGSTVARARTLDDSVSAYVDGLGVPLGADVKVECADILSSVRSVSV